MVDIKDVHIGEAIKKRFDDLKMTKTEFGHKIGVPQQHINRIFEKESIDTKRLVKICHALDFNFFLLYGNGTTNVSAHLSAVTFSGNATNNLGDGALLIELEVAKEKVSNLEESKIDLKDQIQTLKDTVEQMKTQLRDKDEIINLVRNQTK